MELLASHMYWGFNPFMGRGNSLFETTAYSDVGPAFLAIIAKHIVPDGLENPPLDIAEWYKSDNETEQGMCQTSFMCRDSL